MFAISSVNVNGINDKNKRNTIFTHLQNSKSEIIFMQDLKARSKKESDKWFKKWQGQVYVTDSNDVTSTAILFAKNTDFQVNKSAKDPDGRYVLLNVEKGEDTLTLCNIYAPAGFAKYKERTNFFNNLKKTIEEFKTENSKIILGGDFNCVIDKNLDRSNPLSKEDLSTKHLKTLINKFYLEDTWRNHHPDDKEYTFYSNIGSGSRLDKFYTSKNIRTNIIENRIENFAHSDHEKVTMKIDFTEIERGPATWKMNNSYLQDPEYITQMTELWYKHQLSKFDYETLGEWWDEGKMKIKDFSIEYAKRKHFEKKVQKNKLIKQARNAKKKLDKNPEIQMYKDIHDRINNEIKQMEIQEAEGTKIRSKAQWREQGESSTRFFCSLEKKRGEDKTMRRVQRVEKGPIYTTTDDMVKQTRQFYVDLYTEEGVEITAQDSMLDKVQVELSETEAALCDGKVTLAEGSTALKESQNDRSPGTDGLTYEYYKAFWHLVGKDLIDVHNENFERNKMSNSQNLGLLTLLFKKGDRALLSNWRPISLLNTDYKILAKILSMRLTKVLGKLIAEDQTCGVPGRTILNNTFILRDLIILCKEKNIPAAIISVDQMKAFDRVNWSFIWKTLAKFGFGQNFIKWVKLLYSDAQSIVKVNGFLSDPLRLQRGVRQGDPLSPLLYVLVAEVFAISVRQDDSIEGIPVGKIKHKISQYADDTSITVVGNKSIDRIEYHLNLYEKASGAKVNRKKCEGLWLGSNKNRTDKPLGYKWFTDKIKILGIYIGNNNTEKASWEEKITKFKKVLNLWKMRDLSLQGKKTVINILAAACLWYTAYVYPIPDYAISELNNEIWEFFWGSKNGRVKNAVVKLPPDKGGYGVLDLKKKSEALQLTWVSKFFDAEVPGKFKETMNEFLNQYKEAGLGKGVFKVFLKKTKIDEMPGFYRNLLSTWDRLIKDNRPKPTNTGQILTEPLFDNRFIAQERENFNTMIYKSQWCRAGITEVRHITYEAVPKVMPPEALGEIVSEPTGKVQKELAILWKAIPADWKIKITRETAQPDETFEIKHESLNKPKNITKMTSKNFYDMLLYEETKSIPQTYRGKWQTGLKTSLDFKKIFTSIYKSKNDRKANDLRWKIIHLAIPTAVALQGKKPEFPTDLCQICKQHKETIPHLFFYCDKAQRIWKYVNKILRKRFPALDKFKLTILEAVFGFLNLPEIESNPIVTILRDLALRTIWTTRNKLVYDEEKSDSLRVFQARLKQRIKSDFLLEQSRRNTTNFEKTWAYSNKIVEIQKEGLVFHL